MAMSSNVFCGRGTTRSLAAGRLLAPEQGGGCGGGRGAQRECVGGGRQEGAEGGRNGGKRRGKMGNEGQYRLTFGLILPVLVLGARKNILGKYFQKIVVGKNSFF